VESSLQNCLDVTEAVKEAESSLCIYSNESDAEEAESSFCIYSNESDAEKEAGLMQNWGQEWDLL
jgi:hypothetical protein